MLAAQCTVAMKGYQVCSGTGDLKMHARIYPRETLALLRDRLRKNDETG